MNIGQIVMFSLVSLFSALFIVRRCRVATATQRPQIAWAACGAAGVAAGALFLFAFR